MTDILEKIKNSGEKTKKKILIGATIVTMVIVLISWAAYMNAFVFKEASQNETEKIEISFWPAFKSGISGGLKNIKDSISGLISKIKNIGGENKITIENK